MRKYIFFLTLILTSFTLLIQCKKEDDVRVDVGEEVLPIEAIEANVFEDGGVQLVANVNKIPQNVGKYGFVLALDSVISTHNGQFYYMEESKQLAKGMIRKDLNTQLEKNRKYYYSFFTINDSTQLKIYNVKSFLSSGSKQIKIDSISTNHAHLLDSIYVYGKYFANRYINISFGSQGVVTKVLNDSVLTAYIPQDLTEVSPVITARYDTTSKIVSTEFSLYKPEITSFTSNRSFNDIITIEGDHFDLDSNRMSVKFGEVKASFVSVGRKQIKVRVPEDIEKVKTNITVKAQLQSSTGSELFNLQLPTLDIVPTSGKAWQELTIKGKNFHPKLAKNQILFEGVEAELLEGDTSSIRVKVPMGPFPRRAAKVKIKLLDAEVTYKADFKLNDTWVMVSRKFPANNDPYNVHSIEGNVFAYTYGDTYNDKKMYFYKWNRSNYTWTKGTNTATSGRMVALDDKLYYFRSVPSASQLRQYDYKSDTWTDLPAPPSFEQRYTTTAFAAEKHLYLLFSDDWEHPEEPTFPMYRYSIVTKKWEEMAGMPKDLYGGYSWNNAFSISNGKIAIVGAGATMTNSGNLLAYNIASNSWSATPADGPGFLSGAAGFVHNGQIHIIPSSSLNYDFNSRSIYRYEGSRWYQLKELIGPDEGVFSGDSSNAFVVGDKVYVIVWNGGIVGVFEASLADLK
ncbi:IPT/TIG domain-containing protein [Olivibacter domesticus]|uniref:IPT/TIG domain-containing protein n=1 Tax=Olivibacter domesticus TaxID=407022 RepID=A0A1H7UUF8_OLID1|nr:IPT/TIG domain-containing protein [Olivibacter domesticus]SEM00630.1 IPT/TIG domain-containing protein [Olivibacter domesticus]